GRVKGAGGPTTGSTTRTPPRYWGSDWSCHERAKRANQCGRGRAGGAPMNELHPPLSAVRVVVARALAEDLEPLGDITGALIPVDVLVRGELVAREEGVLAGRLSASEAFAQTDPAIVVTWFHDDGEEVQVGARIAA